MKNPLTLTRAIQEFEHWRTTKKYLREKTPDYLREMIEELLSSHSRYTIRSSLKITEKQMQQFMGIDAPVTAKTADKVAPFPMSSVNTPIDTFMNGHHIVKDNHTLASVDTPDFVEVPLFHHPINDHKPMPTTSGPATSGPMESGPTGHELSGPQSPNLTLLKPDKPSDSDRTIQNTTANTIIKEGFLEEPSPREFSRKFPNDPSNIALTITRGDGATWFAEQAPLSLVSESLILFLQECPNGSKQGGLG
ncbi:MAG: hypothetical protein NTX76_02050 [Alphaproteobacteria bacterium]|nr:hypothetical protein [Alphaproteobacteria bacterium]